LQKTRISHFPLPQLYETTFISVSQCFPLLQGGNPVFLKQIPFFYFSFREKVERQMNTRTRTTLYSVKPPLNDSKVTSSSSSSPTFFFFFCFEKKKLHLKHRLRAALTVWE